MIDSDYEQLFDKANYGSFEYQSAVRIPYLERPYYALSGSSVKLGLLPEPANNGRSDSADKPALTV